MIKRLPMLSSSVIAYCVSIADCPRSSDGQGPRKRSADRLFLASIPFQGGLLPENVYQRRGRWYLRCAHLLPVSVSNASAMTHHCSPMRRFGKVVFTENTLINLTPLSVKCDRGPVDGQLSIILSNE